MNLIKRTAICAIVSLVNLSQASVAHAREPQDPRRISGEARVLDGDTLEIAGLRIRLFGIDAPEKSQTCVDAGGHDWNCGEDAKKRLADLVRYGLTECRREQSARDRYGRIIATCRNGTEQEINAVMIREGLAWAFRKYSLRYAAQEDVARGAALGIWAAPNMTAYDYRHRDRHED